MNNAYRHMPDPGGSLQNVNSVVSLIALIAVIT